MMRNIPSLPYDDSINSGRVLETVKYKDETVYIGSQEAFNKVPLETWEFVMCGYQPLKKWLKDKKGIVLTAKDVQHFRKMQYVIEKTIEIMEELK